MTPAKTDCCPDRHHDALALPTHSPSTWAAGRRTLTRRDAPTASAAHPPGVDHVRSARRRRWPLGAPPGSWPPPTPCPTEHAGRLKPISPSPRSPTHPPPTIHRQPFTTSPLGRPSATATRREQRCLLPRKAAPTEGSPA